MSSRFVYEEIGMLLQARDVSLQLGPTLILRDINFQIRNIIRPDCTQGQVEVLLGPSGIGKTQLFRTLAGLQKPTTGCVLLNEVEQPVKQGQVGVVFQNYLLFEHRTVLGNLVVAARQKGMSEKQATEKAREYLDLFGLAERAKFYPAQLSGGQRQRVAIIQQLLSSDHFLLMDEPFSGLSPEMVEQVCEVITKVVNLDELNTTIVVTHDVTAAVSIADRIRLMGRQRGEDGKLLPGATMIDELNLIEMDLAWRPNIAATPECAELVRRIKKCFKDLANGTYQGFDYYV